MSSEDEQAEPSVLDIMSSLRRQVLPEELSALNRTRRLAGYDTPPHQASGTNRVPVLSRHPDTRAIRSSVTPVKDPSTRAPNPAASTHYTAPFDVPAYIHQLNQLSGHFFTQPPPPTSSSSSSSSKQTQPKYWLPTCWDTHDKSSLLDLSSDALSVSFVGSAKYGDRDAAAIRANRSIPPQSAVYYFEVTVLDKGQAGYIGIGVSGPNVSLSRLPGWEKDSWALHGDDGSIFSGRGQGTPFGPTYGTGDVIGVGVDWTHAHSLHRQPASTNHHAISETAKHGPLAKIFFTKNGQMLGPSASSYAFENVACTALYPTIGLRTPGEKVKVNFGADKFLFDISGYARQRRLATLVEFKSLPPVQNTVLHKLMLSYLTHYGYASTATAFAKSVKLAVQDPVAIVRRGRIRKAILEGRLDDARQDLESVASLTSTDSPLPLIRMREWVELYWRRVTSSSAASAAHPSKGKGRAVDVDTAADAMDEDGLDQDEEDLLALGAELNEAYGVTHAAQLEQTFALLAYANTEDMPPDVARLLSQTARDELADQVNRYLLEAEGSPAKPELEVAWRYAEAQRQWASELGTRAALVSIQDAFNS